MSKVKILHFSTHNEDCGVGKYQEQFLESMQSSEEVENKFFEYSPNQTKHMSRAELQTVVNQLKTELADYDILHVQHEFAFYPQSQFVEVCAAAKAVGKRLIITFHTSPDDAIHEARLTGLGPRSVLHYIRRLRHRKSMLANHVAPAYAADAVIVHNKHSAEALKKFGVEADKIRILPMPVPVSKTYQDGSTEISEGLNKQPKDIILCTVGFMHRYKGIFEAIKALQYLPEHYKLAIIGGVNPQSHEVKIYNDITDLVARLGLMKRVYITGYVKEDNNLNKLIQECDIAVYPYNPVYYSHVSSAALNLAFANRTPIVAYPVGTFIEIANESQAILLTNGCSYYELVRSIKSADLKILSDRAARYAEAKSYPVVTKELINIYLSLVRE